MTKQERFVELCKFFISKLSYGEDHLAKVLDICLMYPDDLLPGDVPLREYASAFVRYLSCGGEGEVRGRPEMTKWVADFRAKHGRFSC
ncbi:MAG: hypothetical protein HY711_08905 [Candidatus Melainabacteria bacterium]|nr:hypothetical protein [Candidatus Melainabacteria bacterium]